MATNPYDRVRELAKKLREIGEELVRIDEFNYSLTSSELSMLAEDLEDDADEGDLP